MTRVKLLQTFWLVYPSGKTECAPKSTTLEGEFHPTSRTFIPHGSLTNIPRFAVEVISNDKIWLNTKPPAPGVYKTKRDPTSGVFFSKWDGEKWCRVSAISPEIAAAQTEPSDFQSRYYLSGSRISLSTPAPASKGKSLVEEIAGMFSFLDG